MGMGSEHGFGFGFVSLELTVMVGVKRPDELKLFERLTQKCNATSECDDTTRHIG